MKELRFPKPMLALDMQGARNDQMRIPVLRTQTAAGHPMLSRLPFIDAQLGKKLLRSTNERNMQCQEPPNGS
jgi:hypothetical protein